jgi:hypothetical protein
MHHGSGTAVSIEIITAYSYLLIAIGYGLRQVLESKPQLLWPWLLVTIFLLCGATRVTGFVGGPVPEGLVLAMHLALAPTSLAYGIGQLIYAFWPSLFEDSKPKAATPQARYVPEPEVEQYERSNLTKKLEKLQAQVLADDIA